MYVCVTSVCVCPKKYTQHNQTESIEKFEKLRHTARCWEKIAEQRRRTG